MNVQLRSMASPGNEMRGAQHDIFLSSAQACS